MGGRLNEREKLLFKLDHLSDNEIHEVLDYVSIMEAMKRERAHPEVIEDELLDLLSSARENKRARQVFEWDSVRRRSDARASSHRYPRH
ncbi:MAG TPA: hypothetical protein VFD58_32425 [Blastocatellia bacterium]|nr:hypothetical protein [Blastocatellia bacterium]